MKLERVAVKLKFEPINLMMTLETPEEVAALKRIVNPKIISWGDEESRVAEHIRGVLG